MTTFTTIAIDSTRFEDHDDCLAACVTWFTAQHPEAAGWDFEARWDGRNREHILLDVRDEWAAGYDIASDLT